MKKMLIGTVAGGVTFFLLGGLIYAVILPDFYEANLGSATGVLRELPQRAVPQVRLATR